MKPTVNGIDPSLKELVENTKVKYIQNYDNFKPGKTYVNYSGPFWSDDEVYAAVNSFLNGKWLVTGEKVHQFQAKFSKKYNVAKSHMVNSGSSANLVMVTALKKRFDWSDGDEVIVSPVGFPTTISPLIQNNLKPVFIDIEMSTLNFDVNLIESQINEKTRGIFVSPVLGNPPDMKKLRDICDKHGLILIGDNCDSLGTKWDGELLTDLYHCWSTSFYPAHHITTGEGGMISSNDEELIKLCMSISWWGRDCYCVGAANMIPCGTCGNRFDKWIPEYDGIIDHKYLFTNIGYNLKPLDLQGAIGLEQLNKVDQIDVNRKKIWKHFDEAISSVDGCRTVEIHPESDVSWFGFPIICKDKAMKEKFVAYLEESKIQTRNYFAGNILIHPAFKHLDDYKKYPNSNLALSHVFFIGCNPSYTDEVIEYVKDTLRGFKV